MTVRVPIDVHEDLKFLQIHFTQERQEKVTLQDTCCYTIKELANRFRSEK